jgi:large subunit ribosomal protein L32
MAVPKKKKSKSRRDMGRAHHHVKMPNLALCPECHEPVLSHRICPHCGSYRGKTIIKIEEED